MISVEFMGAPGSGKSTILAHLAKEMHRRRPGRFITTDDGFLIVARERVDKIYRVILRLLPYHLALRVSAKLLNRTLLQFEAQNRFLAQHGQALCAFLTSSASAPLTDDDRAIVLANFVEDGAMHTIMHDDLLQEAAIFFEEGLVQKSIMFVSQRGGDVECSQKLEDYLSSIPLPDLVIYVKTANDICSNRMTLRPRGVPQRLREIGNDSVLIFLERAQKHFDYVAASLQKNTAITLIEIDSTRQLNEVVFGLAEMMAEFFDS